MSREEKRREEKRREEKRRLFFCLLLPVMILSAAGCNTQADQSPKTIFDGSLVKTLDAPDVAYYRKRVLDIVAQTILENGCNHPDYARVVAVFQALQGNSGISRNVVSDPSNQYQLTKEDVEAVDRFLADTPEVVLTMSNTVYEYTNMMQQYVQDKPLTIDVLADPVDITACSPSRNIIPDGDIVEYSYTIYPDSEGFYETGMGAEPGAQFLEDDQQSPADEAPSRGFVITKPSLLKRKVGGGPWANGLIWYWFDDGFASSSSCPRKAAVRAQMEAISSLMTNQYGERKIRFYELGSQSRLLRWLWYISSTAGLRIYIDDKMDANGAGSVGSGFQRRLRYKTWILNSVPTGYPLYVLQHELCHVLGMKHEHQRDDRNTYITMNKAGNYNEHNYGRIKWRYKFLFRTYFQTSAYGTPYDYNSIMHYGIDGTALVRINNPAHRIRGGQVYEFNHLIYSMVNGGTMLSPYDIYTLKRHYGITPNVMPSYTPGTD